MEKRIEKREHVAAEKKGILGGKSRRGVLLVGGKLKRGGPCTPVRPSWSLEGAHDSIKVGGGAGFTLPAVSARNLGATLWEFQDLPIPPTPPPPPKMNRGGVRIRHHKDNPLDLPTHLADPPHSPPNQPDSTGSLRRHVAASLMQHNKLIERSGRALQPVSPASCSSMEASLSIIIAAYNQPGTPTSSLDFKTRFGESGYSLKTSTELLKVLNRIWSLEEQHASNISLVRALKKELDHARARIQELMREQRADRNEMDDLMKQVAEDKLISRSKEQDKIKAAVKSMRDELEDERKLRARSESLHRKLARELSEVKSAFAKAVKELERERKGRVLLEDLCDEFAKGVGDYELELRGLKQKSAKDHSNGDDRLILHFSEAWLDERAQMKLAVANCSLDETDTIVGRLRCEIETLLQAKRSSGSNTLQNIDFTGKDVLRRQSLESVHFNGTTSAPQDAGEDEDSEAGDVRCLELNENVDGAEKIDRCKLHHDKANEDLEEIKKSIPASKKVGLREKIKPHSASVLQAQFEEEMVSATRACEVNKKELVETVAEADREKASPNEVSLSQKTEKGGPRDGRRERKAKRDGIHGLNHMIGNLIRSGSPFSEGTKVRPDSDNREDSCGHFSLRGHSAMGTRDNVSGDSHGLSSPVQQWNFRNASPDLEISQSSSKWPRSLKESTLKAKLLEARIEGQHARMKTTKGP
ncbi:hypothetical protein ACLOJK_014514 [Asimina triloba]